MSVPRFSVMEFTTPDLTFAEDLDVYAGAGATGIGISEDKLGDDREDLARLKDSGLAASSFFPSVTSILPSAMAGGPPEPEQRVAGIARSIRRLASFEPPSCYIVPGPLGDYGRAEGRAVVIDGCRTLAAVAAEEGMKLGLELLHPSLAARFSFMTSLPDAIALLDEVGAPNMTIVLDCWHLDEAEETLGQVRRHAKRFASLHLNDRRDPTRSWCDRVLPGDGTIDLERLFGALDAGGFEGWFELEVVSDDGRVADDFPDSLWKWDPGEVVATGRRQFLELWERRHEPR